MYAQIIWGYSDSNNFPQLFRLADDWHSRHGSRTCGLLEVQFTTGVGASEAFEIRLLFSDLYSLSEFTSSSIAMEYLTQSKAFALGDLDFSVHEVRIL